MFMSKQTRHVPLILISVPTVPKMSQFLTPTTRLCIAMGTLGNLLAPISWWDVLSAGRLRTVNFLNVRVSLLQAVQLLLIALDQFRGKARLGHFEGNDGVAALWRIGWFVSFEVRHCSCEEVFEAFWTDAVVVVDFEQLAVGVEAVCAHV